MNKPTDFERIESNSCKGCHFDELNRCKMPVGLYLEFKKLDRLCSKPNKSWIYKLKTAKNAPRNEK